MSIKIGNTSYSNVYVGDTEIIRAYVGDTMFFNTGTPPQPTEVELWGWGNNFNHQILPVSGFMTNNEIFNVPTYMNVDSWKKISSHGNSVVAIKEDGTLWQWGLNLSTQITTPTQVGTDSDWKDVEASNVSRYAIKTNGTLWAWGFNNNGILGVGDTTNRQNPTQVGTNSDWKMISAGGNHGNDTTVLAIKENGTLWAWGSNARGKSGLGTISGSNNSPTQVGSDTNWKTVSCLLNHTHAIKTNGTLWSCGFNSSARTGLGINNNTNTTTFTQVGSDTDWKDVYAGNLHGVAFKIDNTPWGWGNERYFGMSGGVQTTPIQLSTDTDWKKMGCHTEGVVYLKENGEIYGMTFNIFNGIHGREVNNPDNFMHPPVRISPDYSDYIDFFIGNNTIYAFREIVENPIVPTGISVLPTSITLNASNSPWTFQHTVTPSNARNKGIRWNTNNWAFIPKAGWNVASQFGSANISVNTIVGDYQQNVTIQNIEPVYNDIFTFNNTNTNTGTNNNAFRFNNINSYGNIYDEISTDNVMGAIFHQQSNIEQNSWESLWNNFYKLYLFNDDTWQDREFTINFWFDNTNFGDFWGDVNESYNQDLVLFKITSDDNTINILRLYFSNEDLILDIRDDYVVKSLSIGMINPQSTMFTIRNDINNGKIIININDMFTSSLEETSTTNTTNFVGLAWNNIPNIFLNSNNRQGWWYGNLEFYSKNLTDTEIQDLYNLGIQGRRNQI